MTKQHHEMWITINKVNVVFEILLHAGDSPITYIFVDWKHFLGHFGSMLCLTDCPIRIHCEE